MGVSSPPAFPPSLGLPPVVPVTTLPPVVGVVRLVALPLLVPASLVSPPDVVAGPGVVPRGRSCRGCCCTACVLCHRKVRHWGLRFLFHLDLNLLVGTVVHAGGRMSWSDWLELCCWCVGKRRRFLHTLSLRSLSVSYRTCAWRGTGGRSCCHASNSLVPRKACPCLLSRSVLQKALSKRGTFENCVPCLLSTAVIYRSFVPRLKPRPQWPLVTHELPRLRDRGQVLLASTLQGKSLQVAEVQRGSSSGFTRLGLLLSLFQGYLFVVRLPLQASC